MFIIILNRCGISSLALAAQHGIRIHPICHFLVPVWLFSGFVYRILMLKMFLMWFVVPTRVLYTMLRCMILRMLLRHYMMKNFCPGFPISNRSVTGGIFFLEL